MNRAALLIGVSEYEADLPSLLSARQDVIAIRQVLENPKIGGFNKIRELLDPDRQSMEEAIELLFGECGKDDLVLLFFSGHGIKDDRGRLYFATRYTRKTETGDLIRSTAVAANFVHEVMGNSRAKRQVIVLDCCFSGAFATGMSAKAGQTENIAADIKAQLESEGRAVLTSSTATQYSFEANQAESDLSIYTRYLIEGLSTGAADLDSDGVISIDELHEYARAKVQEAAPAMKPEIYAVREGYKIQIAKAPVGDPRLLYRKEVEELVRSSQGEISSLDRRILKVHAVNLKLNLQNVSEIEAEVLQPYQERKRRLQEYEQAWAEVVQQEAGVSEMTRTKLKRLQQALNLRDEDVAQIEAAMPIQERKPTSTPSPIPIPKPTPAPKTNPSSRSPQPTSNQRLGLISRPVSREQPPLISRLSRQQFLKWAGLGSAWFVTTLVVREIIRNTTPTSTSISVAAPKYTQPTEEVMNGIPLWKVDFETVIVNERGEVIDRPAKQANFFKEDLGNGVVLEMVKIPGGSFKMGSPETEKDRSDSESPQRTVNVPSFFIGKFAVTQAQYQAIMGNNPANFKVDKRPVETVSWSDAIEFCWKLSDWTSRTYRLPSEAEWEYACRAETTTPFHFGETITGALANYDARAVYRSEPKGEYRQQTTDVGTFPPNAFGLYDMHGNVWEWCADHWHENYQGAPIDGSAWLSDDQNASRLLRGGSWSFNPAYCRSAYRSYHVPASRNFTLGFRVVCVLA